MTNRGCIIDDLYNLPLCIPGSVERPHGLLNSEGVHILACKSVIFNWKKKLKNQPWWLSCCLYFSAFASEEGQTLLRTSWFDPILSFKTSPFH